MLVVTLSYAALYTWTYIEQTPRRYDAHEVLETRRVVCLSSKCNVCTRPSAYCPSQYAPHPTRPRCSSIRARFLFKYAVA